ncbi:MAG: biopolymer transporter ExbD [Pseudomonadota bacterium]
MSDRRGSGREPTIALINIVFLMLVFFMVAGTLARPIDPSLTLVETSKLDQAPPPDALVLHADGRLTFRGEEVTGAPEGTEIARVVPDRDAAAADLVALARRLVEEGAEKVVIVTEQGL